VEPNETQTASLQQRCLYLTRDIGVGEILSAADVEALRPLQDNSFKPYELVTAIGKKMLHGLKRGEFLLKSDLE